jgi:hypothetical protein
MKPLFGYQGRGGSKEKLSVGIGTQNNSSHDHLEEPHPLVRNFFVDDQTKTHVYVTRRISPSKKQTFPKPTAL